MDYEKMYREALERANFAHKDEDRHLKATLERIFPELNESEDERIRKGLIKGLSAMRDIHKHQTFSDDAININDAIDWLEKQGEQPSWSEADIEMLDNCLGLIQEIDSTQEEQNWLKSLKDRFQLQPKQEWSKEDEKMWLQIINEMEAFKAKSSTIFEKNIAQDKIDWLKSLKSQNKWKPTNDQLYILNWVANTLLNQDGIVEREAAKVLNEIHEELKKL